MMQEQFLKIASHVPQPMVVAACAFVIALAILLSALYTRTSRFQRFIRITLAVVVAILGLAPFAASRFVQSRGVYRVQLVVLGQDGAVVDYAQVKSSYGGELRMVDGGWELVIPPQALPADSKITFSASVNDEFVNGRSTVVLAQDYFPTATIQLAADTSARVRGVVVDENLVAVAGATVSIAGYPDVATTDKMGTFVLPAHAGKGQMVELRAQKDQWSGQLSAPAGKVVEIIMSRE